MLLLAVPFSSFAQVDAIDRYFRHYVEDTSFTSVYVSPKMFSLIGNLEVDENDEELSEMIKGLKGLRILTTEKNARSLYKEAIAKFNTSEYESLMTVKGDGEDVNFWIKSDGNTISELLLLVGGDEFVMLSLVGNINLDKISEFAESMDIEGSEHLEKLKEKED